VVATLRKLLAQGLLDGSQETVILNTGDGLKTLDVLADLVGPTATIAHDVDEVTRVLAEHHARAALDADAPSQA